MKIHVNEFVHRNIKSSPSSPQLSGLFFINPGSLQGSPSLGQSRQQELNRKGSSCPELHLQWRIRVGMFDSQPEGTQFYHFKATKMINYTTFVRPWKILKIRWTFNGVDCNTQFDRVWANNRAIDSLSRDVAEFSSHLGHLLPTYTHSCNTRT